MSGTPDDVVRGCARGHRRRRRDDPAEPGRRERRGGPRADGTACCRSDSAAQLNVTDFARNLGWFKFVAREWYNRKHDGETEIHCSAGHGGCGRDGDRRGTGRCSRRLRGGAAYRHSICTPESAAVQRAAQGQCRRHATARRHRAPAARRRRCTCRRRRSTRVRVGGCATESAAAAMHSGGSGHLVPGGSLVRRSGDLQRRRWQRRPPSTAAAACPRWLLKSRPSRSWQTRGPRARRACGGFASGRGARARSRNRLRR